MREPHLIEQMELLSVVPDGVEHRFQSGDRGYHCYWAPRALVAVMVRGEKFGKRYAEQRTLIVTAERGRQIIRKGSLL